MAGTWAEGFVLRESYLNGAPIKPIGVEKSFTDDAVTPSIPEETVDDVGGLLTGIDVEFDGTAPPDALVVAIKTMGGITLVTSSSLTASGRVAVSPPLDVCGGYKIACTGNTNVGAKAKIVCLFR